MYVCVCVCVRMSACKRMCVCKHACVHACRNTPSINCHSVTRGKRIYNLRFIIGDTPKCVFMIKKKKKKKGLTFLRLGDTLPSRFLCVLSTITFPSWEKEFLQIFHKMIRGSVHYHQTIGINTKQNTKTSMWTKMQIQIFCFSLTPIFIH